MEIDDSQSLAYCSYCGTKHLIKKEVNVTNNYYGGGGFSGGTVPFPITEQSIERAKNYRIYFIAGVLLVLTGVILAILGFTVFAERHTWPEWSSFADYTTPNASFIFPGFMAAGVGMFLVVIGLNYRRIHEMSGDGSLNGPGSSSFCTGCGKKIDPSSKYCKFCGTLQR
ncbi:MAG: zinc ribbon domain-containing protein [Methanomassiliicoccaceae archaeon]|jgi:hypothetical protein|nr:zinc ribbon domain-containing protein [Methanomassiliicoccaceae archaeon]